MADLGSALEITLMALATLLVISLFFVALTRGLQWLTRVTSGERVAERRAVIPKEKEERAVIAMAAVAAYLEAERQAEARASSSESPKQKGRDEA